MFCAGHQVVHGIKNDSLGARLIKHGPELQQQRFEVETLLYLFDYVIGVRVYHQRAAAEIARAIIADPGESPYCFFATLRSY